MTTSPAAEARQTRAISPAHPRVPWWAGWELTWLPLTALLVPPAWPRWAFMWALAFAIYLVCKWLTWRRRRFAGSPARRLGYWLAWPGLDADTFLDPAARRGHEPTMGEWAFATGKLLVGLCLFAVATPRLMVSNALLAGWVAMAGVVFSLHFGLFHLLSCAWRSAGVAARPLMHWPVLSTSVSEFWGRRWNTAFRDLTHRFLFRPLRGVLGGPGAVFAGFAFSGLVHELVITVPAGGGYGGPTLFFLLQGLALLLERSRVGRHLGLGRGWRGWLFTACLLVVTAGLLFPPAFVRGVMAPFVADVTARFS